MDESQLIKAVVHYQQGLERNIRKNDDQKMLHYISKLFRMPVKVEHLEQTGVGRTVNSLRRISGEVGDAAKSLVAKWKSMVMECDESPPKQDTSSKHEVSGKHKESHSSHIKESDKRHKYQNKEKKSSRSSSSSSSSKKNYGDSKNYKKEDSEVSNKEKNSKYQYSTSNEVRLDSDSDEEIKEVKKHSNKHKLLRNKYVDELSDDSESEKSKTESHTKSSSKRKNKDDAYKMSKRIREDDSSSSKKYESSKSNISDDELISEEEIKKSSKITKCNIEYNNEVKIKHSHKEKEKHKHEKSVTRHNNSKHLDKTDKSKEKVKNVTSSKNSSFKYSKEHRSSNKSNVDMAESGIGSSSGASFAEALGMLEPSSNKGNKKKVALVHPLPRTHTTTKCGSSSPEITSKEEIVKSLTEQKLEPLDINVSSLLPEITPNYRPLGNYMLSNDLIKNKVQNEDRLLVEIMNSKISRTKVYSGNKVSYSKVPSLFELCTRVLKDNIDALEYTGGVPYDILKPVIERASPNQLFTLEHHNPYLIEDTDQLWAFHCQKQFRTKKREEMETWREMYVRCLDERELKLKALTANIKLSQDKSLPVRQTKLAYVDSFVKPPRAVLRKQAKHGTGNDKKPIMTPSARLAGIATSSAIGQVSVPNPGARAASSSGSSASVKPKKAPLMQKTLAFMKNRHFRR